MIHIDTNYSPETLHNMISLDVISTEAQIAVFNRVGDLASTVKNKVVGILTNQPRIDSINYPKRKMGKFLKENSYVDLMNVGIYKPTNVNVPYMTVMETIIDLQSELLGIEDRSIKPFTKWLSTVITNPEKMQLISDDMPVITAPDGLTDKLNKIYDPSDNTDKYKYEEALENNSQWEILIRMMRIAINNQNRVPSGKLLASVEKISALSDKLIDGCINKPDIYKSSKESRLKIGDSLYSIGEEVTLIGRLYTLLQSQKVAIEDSVNLLLELKAKGSA